jgi:uncharacterized membrane protein
MQIFLEAPKPGGMAVDPIAKQRGPDQSENVDEGTLDGAEDRAVHDGKRVGNGERGRCDHDEDGNRERVCQRTDRSNLVRDPRLMFDHKEGDQERGEQQRQGGSPAKKTIQAMEIRLVITLLCGVGLYASLFMLNKSRRAARGELTGPSVVKTPRAHLFGVPNSLLGALYYTALAVAVWFVNGPIEQIVLIVAALAAAATSAYLAYSLLFVTRRDCPYCWTSHVVNWSLFLLCSWLFLPGILNLGT